MSFRYKTDVLDLLKLKGFNTNKIRKEKIIGEAMLQKLRSGQMVSWAVLETICKLLDCQPGDLIEFIDD
ncbi:MAG: helix-turn-helix transcriptional regulator [bacterium]|nr:helix-turn-helix transcriptional regulator [bacterium]